MLHFKRCSAAMFGVRILVRCVAFVGNGRFKAGVNWCLLAQVEREKWRSHFGKPANRCVTQHVENGGLPKESTSFGSLRNTWIQQSLGDDL